MIDNKTTYDHQDRIPADDWRWIDIDDILCEHGNWDPEGFAPVDQIIAILRQRNGDRPVDIALLDRFMYKAETTYFCDAKGRGWLKGFSLPGDDCPDGLYEDFLIQLAIELKATTTDDVWAWYSTPDATHVLTTGYRIGNIRPNNSDLTIEAQ